MRQMVERLSTGSHEARGRETDFARKRVNASWKRASRDLALHAGEVPVVRGGGRSRVAASNGDGWGDDGGRGQGESWHREMSGEN